MKNVHTFSMVHTQYTHFDLHKFFDKHKDSKNEAEGRVDGSWEKIIREDVDTQQWSLADNVR